MKDTDEGHFEWTSNEIRPTELECAYNDDNLVISITEEHFMDIHDQYPTCRIALPREQAERLCKWLASALAS